MEYLTLQQVVTKVTIHLLMQNEKSFADNQSPIEGSCAYRGEGDLKCAVGCVIDDEFYTPYIEGLAIGDVLYYPDDKDLMFFAKILKSSGIDPKDQNIMNFLKDAQYIHDMWEVEEWENELLKLAVKYSIYY